MTDPAESVDRRVLILAPTKKDATTTQSLLTPVGIPNEICMTLDALITEIWRGAAAILIPEEVVASGVESLAAVIARQPTWSDLPVLVLARPGADSSDVADAVRTLGNVMVLERPLRVATLMSAIRTALRARERQYEIRGYLDERSRTEEALRVADRRKDEFLATLGHELRNPLAPMLAGLTLLNRADLADPGSREAVAIMQRQVHHLHRLVDDLLEVSRITRGLIPLETETLDLTAVLKNAIQTSLPLVESEQQEISVELPSEQVLISGDSVRLTQVFANLLNNASKYTNYGGHIWVNLSTAGGWARVSVRDDGIGIPPAQLGSVFEMFTQVDRSHRQAQGGLGIGLTLVQQLVASHGGVVEAYSEGLDRGSEFVVRLPLAEAGVAPAAPAESEKPFPPCRLMIVDDNPDVAKALVLLLSALGATVVAKHNGPEALEALKDFRPDALLLDIGMPGMDGFEVARRIRESEEHAGILLIALTGWGQDVDRIRSGEAGFDHHLVKPPDLEQLGSILTTQLPSVRRADPRADGGPAESAS